MERNEAGAVGCARLARALDTFVAYPLPCHGPFVGGTILFGDADAEPLLGVTALESVGIVVPNFPFLYPLRYTPAPAS